MNIKEIYQNAKKYPKTKRLKTCLIEKSKYGLIIYPIKEVKK